MMLSVILTLIPLAAASFIVVSAPTAHRHLTTAGGVFGLITAFIGWYVTYEGLATPENTFIVPPVLLMPSAVVGTKLKKVSDEEKV